MTARTGARRRLLRSLLTRRTISSQRQMVTLLAEAGHAVTQATVSRDLDAIGAVKNGTGRQARYVLVDTVNGEGAERTLATVLAGFVVAIVPSGNLVVLRTPPGAAQVVAAAIDAASLQDVVGTVAGDDTVLAVAADGSGGWRLAKELERIGAGR